MSGIQTQPFGTKIVLIVIVGIITYLLVILISGFFTQPGIPMHHMMNPTQNSIGLVALPLAILIGAVFAYWLNLGRSHEPHPQVHRLDILKQALSADEHTVLQEIQRAGEITQDSLRFRLDWSKAKLSRILTRLDKMNLIQRERVGKTYNVFIPEQRK
jgi:uncharacterized membrane protein